MGIRGNCNSIAILQGVLRQAAMLFCFLVLVIGGTANAEPPNLLIISDSKSSIYTNLYEKIQSNNPSHTFTLKSIEETTQNDLTTGSTSALVSIGAKSAEWLSDQKTSLPSISILASISQLQPLKNKKNSSTIHIEQPVERVAKVVSDTLPRVKTGNLLVSNKYKGPVKEASQSNAFSLSSKIIEKSSNLTRIIRQLRGKIDVLVAYPDSEVYNAQTLKNILISTYKNNIPLIGYSKGFTRAGALLSVYTPPEYYAEEVTDWIKHDYPIINRSSRYFKVDVNKNVAKSLNIQIDDSIWLSKDIWEADDE